MREKWKPTKTELCAQGTARSRASKQLLRVSSRDFTEEQRKYVRWGALALWVRAVVESEEQIAPLVVRTLNRNCPGFLESEGSSVQPGLLGVHLDSWLHRHVFARAKREGWLDALLFYGVREPKSQCVWAYWERCEQDWNQESPTRYPTFASWFRSASQYEVFPKVSVRRLVTAVESYIDWISFAFWVESALKMKSGVPPHVASALTRRLPGFRESLGSSANTEQATSTSIEARATQWVEERNFADALKESWISLLREQVRNDPRYVRIFEYAMRWRKQQNRGALPTYPAFEQWCQAAQNYTEGVGAAPSNKFAARAGSSI